MPSLASSTFLFLGLTMLATSDIEGQTFAGTVTPFQTDPQINTFNNVHTWALDFSNPSRGKLFVMLPGTGGIPFVYQQIVRAAANAGYHAVGLMYVNPTSIVELCAAKVDAECNVNARMEVITGTNFSSFVSINRANSIENRLAKLVNYLNTTNPALQWNQFLDSQTNIIWSKVVIAGHSQGGGHAALIAKIHEVDRCLMFASMDWRFIPSEGVPAWVGEPGRTPPERYFGLGHYDDPTVASNRIVSNWTALDLPQFAPEMLVDGEVAPYGSSHMLMTDLPTTNAHSCMISDLAMITNLNGSVYSPVWNWMLTGPTVLPELAITSPLAISYEARTGWEYQLELSADFSSFNPEGDPVSQTNGVVSTGLTPQNSGVYRVKVAY